MTGVVLVSVVWMVGKGRWFRRRKWFFYWFSYLDSWMYSLHWAHCSQALIDCLILVSWLADGLSAELLAHFSTQRRDLVSGAYLNSLLNWSAHMLRTALSKGLTRLAAFL